MKIKKIGKKYFVRIEKGEEVMEALKKACVENTIDNAIISGIGGCDLFEVGLFNLEKKKYFFKKYKGNHEIASLLGNASLKDGEVFLHIHAVFARIDSGVVGGHLKSAKISVTAEIIIEPIDAQIQRKFDEKIGVWLLDF